MLYLGEFDIFKGLDTFELCVACSLPLTGWVEFGNFLFTAQGE